MIIKPSNWMNDLEAELDVFLKFLKEEGTIGKDFDYHLERFYFITAFIMRKLLESNKLSGKLASSSYKVIYFERSKDAAPDYCFNMESDYNINAAPLISYLQDAGAIDNNLYCRISFKDILNTIIHSSTLNVVCSSNDIYGILVTTEKRNQKLFFMEFFQMKSIVQNCLSDLKQDK